MLGMNFAKKTDQEIKKEMDRKRDEILRRADALRPLVLKNQEGWKAYTGLIQNYIDACKKRKAITALDRLIPGNPADDKILMEIKLIDHDIFILTWVLEFPFTEIDRAEKIIKEGNKE